MTLHPAPPDTGIVFRRIGSAARSVQLGQYDQIASCTVLSDGEGIRIGTVEHVMAALAGAAIDNAIVEVDGSEVPIMDGSAAPFLFLTRVRRHRRAGCCTPRDKGAQAGQHR